MGSLAEAQSPHADDLRVTILRSSTISPSQSAAPPRSMFLSNIDRHLTFDVDTVHYFSANLHFPPETVARRLEDALRRLLLTPYDFLAGRLRFNSQEERLEIDCNGAGVGFSVASSELALDEIGDLVFPNPAFQQLIGSRDSQLKTLALEDKPLLHFQVTGFKCGGFAIAMANSHTTFDGLSARMFLENLASLAAGKPQLSTVPCNDRRLLAARNPPRVEFPHPELVNLEDLQLTLPAGDDELCPGTVLDSGANDLTFKVYRLDASSIAGLKEKARAGGASGPAATGFNVVAAHVWRCKVVAMAPPGKDPTELSRVLYSIDLRSRLRPPLPASYAGNAVLTAYGAAEHGAVATGPFGKLVEALREGATRMTDEYARSVVDWGEVHVGYPRGDVVISSWWKLGFSEVEYPWGRPVYSGPIMLKNSEIIVLVPDRRDEADSAGEGGLNVCLGLPEEGMKKFERLFYEFLG